MINQYPGTCAACRTNVPAHGGQRLQVDGTWRTYHEGCVPVRVAPPAGDHDGWHTGPMVAFDVETTLPDPFEARVVQAALCPVAQQPRVWLVNPGVPIPADATARHHITDEQVRREGRPAIEALAEIGEAVNQVIASGTPLVAFYASFDVTVLHSELTRHGLPAIDWSQAVIIDPFILHKQVEPRWWGKKTLSDLCAYYEVPLTNAHTADADATATLALARSIAARHPRIAMMDPEGLHRAQVDWFATDAAGLQAYYDRRGISRTVSTEWPLETVRRS